MARPAPPLPIVLLLLAACATPPAPLASGPFAAIGHQQALAEVARGERVRWGGSVVKTTPQEEETCFEIVAHPLDRRGRPRSTDTTAGRFVACAPGFFDPAVYRLGRELTVIGRVAEPEEGRIGDHPYRYPKLTAETVYLWPERRVEYGSPWYPGWYPDPFWYGPWYGPPYPWPRYYYR